MNTQLTVSLQIDPTMSEAVDDDLLRNTLGDGSLTVSSETHPLGAYRDAGQIAPIVLSISAVISAAASVGATKMIELFAEDVYKYAKKTIKALFKGKPEARREVRLELRNVEPMIQARVLSSNPDIFEQALIQDLSTFINQTLVIVEQKKSPCTLTYYDVTTEQEDVINAGDLLPVDIQWVLIQYDVTSKGWLVKSLLTKDNKIYFVE